MKMAAEQIKAWAREAGFAACGMARVAPADSEAVYLDEWLARGYQADMHYMANHRAVRLDPALLVEGAKTVISVALNYYPAVKQSPEAPRIAYYAYGKDYHIVVKERLQMLWNRLLAAYEVEGEKPLAARCFTDTAPLLERYWAWRAGLGWIGKHTNLIIPGKGSFFFLGEIVTTAEVDHYDEPMPNRCGSCTCCLEACPTGALEQAGKLNACRCLSYLTIENREEVIPEEQASKIGNRLYGCDTCQEACPWNRFATPTEVTDFHPSESLLFLRKEDLKDFSREKYSRIFAKSAVKRAKYEGLIRNIRTLNK